MGVPPRYIGLASTTIDAKHRVTLPAKFRSRLPASMDGNTVLYVMPAADFRALEVFDSESGARRVEEMNGDSGLQNAHGRSLKRLLALMEQVEMDRQGRILLPKSHVAYAMLKKDVVVAGAGDHLEIYDPDQARDNAAFIDIETLDPAAVSRLYDDARASSGGAFPDKAHA